MNKWLLLTLATLTVATLPLPLHAETRMRPVVSGASSIKTGVLPDRAPLPYAVPQYFDLALESVTIPTPFKAGAPTGSFNLTVKNIGTAGAPSSAIGISCQGELCKDMGLMQVQPGLAQPSAKNHADIWSYSMDLPPLAAGQSTSRQLTFSTSPLRAGQFGIVVQVDDRGEPAGKFANNWVNKQITVAPSVITAVPPATRIANQPLTRREPVAGRAPIHDLVARSIKMVVWTDPKQPLTTALAGQSVNFVCNTAYNGSGTVEANIFKVVVLLNGSVLPHNPHPYPFPMSKGQEYDGNYQWVASAPGTYTATCLVDSDNKVLETNEQNNRADLTFTVKAPVLQ